MEEALVFARALEAWIYLLLGVGGLYFIRRFILAWGELRGAAFGLERDNAQVRLNQSAGALVILLTLAISEFILVTFIAPAVPGAMPFPTPTLNPLASPTITLPAGTPGPEGNVAQVTPEVLAASPGCIPNQINITSPRDRDSIMGVVKIIGTADIPNFGFYKFEIKRPDETVWLTIQAGNSVVKEGPLGDWDTSRLTPGEYDLALVVVDSQAQVSEPCIVRVRVLPAPEPTPSS
jgi:hypothetical protein